MKCLTIVLTHNSPNQLLSFFDRLGQKAPDLFARSRILVLNQTDVSGLHLEYSRICDNAGVGQDFGYAVVKKILREYAVIGFHRGGGDGDNPSRAEFFGNAESDGSAHGMTRENGAVRNDHAAGRESANERRGAGFSLGGREGSRGAAVAGKVGDVHAEALFGEGAADVLHDDVVGGDAVEENHRAEFGGGGKIFTFDSENLHAAGGGVDDIAFFGVATAGEIDESAADEQTEDASERFVSLRNRFQRESSPEMAQVRA